mgnify:FL=1
MPLYPWRQDPAIRQLVIPSLQLYPKLAEELYENTGIDPEWDPCGLFIIQNSDLDLANDWCNNYGVRYSEAAPASVAELHGQWLNPLFLPGIPIIRNSSLLKSLLQF